MEAICGRRQGIPTKRFTPEQVTGTLRHADVRLGQGKKVAEAINALGVTDAGYYRRRQEYERSL